MRNPKRIKTIMNILTEIWELQPDIRFNQLIHNLQTEYANKYPAYYRKAFEEEVGWGMIPIVYKDLFNVEDDEFLTFLQEKLDEMSK